MKIKLLTSRAGIDFSQNAGDVIDVSEAEGLRMVAGGQAELVRSVNVERAVSKNKYEETNKG